MKQSSAAHIQALVSADVILPGSSSKLQLLVINLASVPGGQLVNFPTAQSLERWLQCYIDLSSKFSNFFSLMTFFDLIVYLVFGLIIITLIDTLGAIASRKMNFKYGFLSIISFAVYVLIAFLVSKKYNIGVALFANAVLGLYDGTIGFWLSIILRANTGQKAEQASQLIGTKSAILMIIFSLFCGIIGYGLSTI